MRRFLIKASILIVTAIAITAGAVYAMLRRSLPVIDGVVTVNGVSAPVEIIRDRGDIPHIFAASRADALYGLGYVHAQDRLWQMEFQRRIAFGRLSEIFGAATIPQDRFLRTVGFGRAAADTWQHTPASAQQQIRAYVAGINAFISMHHGSALGPEFALLRFEPEPWSGADVLAWVKMMAWDLSGNYSYELLRNDLVRTVGMARMRQLMPAYDPSGLSIVGEYGEGDALAPAPPRPRVAFKPVNALLTARFADSGMTPPPEGIGSNNWVVDGTMTASGKPMLANDPHLSTRIPSTWYLAHLSAPGFEVIGGTLPGVPGVVLGRNRRIAWGMTNVLADVEDLFREHVDGSGRLVEFRGALEPLTILPETIVVKGAAPVSLQVRISRHGPLISDPLNATDEASTRAQKPPPLEPLALKWTALDPDDSTIVALLQVNDARNWSEFTNALRSFVVPSQNFVYADVDGHIGYYGAGRIPIRASGDGGLPADGWTGEAEWIGWVPFDRLPHLYDPPEHFIVTANHRPAPQNYPYVLGAEWYTPHRAQRIIDLLRGRTKLGPDDFAAIQADIVSLHAKELLPLLLQHAHPTAEADRRATDLLRSWTFTAAADSPATAIFEAWFYALGPALVQDDLGPIVSDAYNLKTTFMARFVEHTIATSDVSWCDDQTTADRRESCDDITTKALHEAVTDLTRRLGPDLNRWRWDAVHRAVFPHQGLDAVAALRPLVSRSMPTAGDWATVNVGTVAADHRYEQHLAPGYRQIVDLSPADDSRFVDALGESGHLLSAHYDDFLGDWRAVRYRSMSVDKRRIEADAVAHLRLIPR